MPADDILRMRYRERQYLRARDFQQEQEYLLESRRRHQIGEHTWGIVTGLNVDKNASNIWAVGAGFAIDAYGREIYLFEDEPLDTVALAAEFVNMTMGSVKLWIAYSIEPTSPAKGSACNDELLNTRTRESFELIYQDDPPPFDGTPTPPVAYQDLPDDPDLAPWPVFLGTIHWKNGDVEKFDPAGRTYAGLRGVEVFSETGQFDIHAKDVRILTGGADDATLTTDAKKTLHISTAGNAEVFVDKDKLHVAKDIVADANVVITGTAGDANGKLRVAVDGSGLAILTRPAGMQNLALRTDDGNGNNEVLVDKDDFKCGKALTVDGAFTVKGGITLQGGQIVLNDAAGGTDTDPMSIARVHVSPDHNDLRIRLGDNNLGDDRFLVGPIINNQFKENFVVDNAGKVTTADTVNGRNMTADGIKLDGISPGATQVTVLRGVLFDGIFIPLPPGYTLNQCGIIVSPAYPLPATLSRPVIGCDCGYAIVTNKPKLTMKWREIDIFGSGYTPIPGFAQYLVVGVK